MSCFITEHDNTLHEHDNTLHEHDNTLHDRLYIALQGDIGIYVSQKDSDTDDKFNAEVLQTVNKAAESKTLDRSQLGVLVFGGELEIHAQLFCYSGRTGLMFTCVLGR